MTCWGLAFTFTSERPARARSRRHGITPHPSLPMSETGDGPASNAAEPSESEQPHEPAVRGEDAVERVLDALTPLTERMDHMGGFAVAHAHQRGPGNVPDPREVEVRFYYPDRHPREADMAMGMLQGNGYTPEKRKRGRASKMCIFLSVPVTEGGDPREPGDTERRSPSASEQGSL